MKGIINTLGICFAAAIGYKAGGWLWNNVLEEKVYKLKDRLATKN